MKALEAAGAGRARYAKGRGGKRGKNGVRSAGDEGADEPGAQSDADAEYDANESYPRNNLLSVRIALHELISTDD